MHGWAPFIMGEVVGRMSENGRGPPKSAPDRETTLLRGGTGTTLRLIVEVFLGADRCDDQQGYALGCSMNGR